MTTDLDSTQVIDGEKPPAVPGGLVGRSGAFDRLRQSCRRAEPTLVTGPPGVGKTHLVEAFVAADPTDGDGGWRLVRADGCTSLDELLHLLERDLLDEASDSTAPDERLAKISRAAASRGLGGIAIDGLDALEAIDDLLGRWCDRTDGLRLIVTRRRDAPALDEAIERIRLEGLSPSDGADLFVEAGRRLLGDYDPAPSEREAIERLSETVDGLPLALELAANRLQVMSPAQMLERARDQFDMVGPPGDGTGLREAIAWSWSQLTDSEQRVLAQCSVFAAPFTLEAAEFVIARPDDALPLSDILHRLVAANWLETERTSDGRVRFAWLRTLRTFADANLRDAGEHEATQRRHADYFGRLARQLGEQMPTTAGAERLSRLRECADELLEICDRLCDTAPADAFDIARAFRWPTTLGQMSARRIEPRLERLLDRLDPDRHATEIARVAAWLAELAVRDQNYEGSADWAAHAESVVDAPVAPTLAAEIQHAKSLSLARVDPDLARRRLEDALAGFDDGSAGEEMAWFFRGRLRERLGFLALERFELDRARQQFRAGRDLLAGRAHPLATTGLHAGLAWVQFRRGNGRAAVAGMRRAAELEAEFGGARAEASAHFNLGACLHARGELEAAEEAWSRSEQYWEESGERGYRVLLAVRRGLVALERDETATATEHLEEAVELAYTTDDPHNRAIAEGYLEALDFVSADRRLDPAGFASLIGDMSTPGAPDAAAVLRAFQAVANARAGRAQRAADGLRDIRQIVGVLGDQDRYFRSHIGSILHATGRVLTRTASIDAGRIEPILAEIETPLAAGIDDLLEERARLEDVGDFRNHHLRLLLRLLVRHRMQRDEAHRPPSGGEPAIDHTDDLIVHEHGNWFSLRGESPVDLRHRGPLRRLLARLAACYRADDEEGCSVETLVEAGWPDEVLTESSGKNRVYSSVRLLRDIGLGDALSTGDAGYFLEADGGLRLTNVPFEAFERREDKK